MSVEIDYHRVHVIARGNLDTGYPYLRIEYATEDGPFFVWQSDVKKATWFFRQKDIYVILAGIFADDKPRHLGRVEIHLHPHSERIKEIWDMRVLPGDRYASWKPHDG